MYVHLGLAWECIIYILVCICRRIENPRIVLLDCSLEYKKGESQVPLKCQLLCVVSVQYITYRLNSLLPPGMVTALFFVT